MPLPTERVAVNTHRRLLLQAGAAAALLPATGALHAQTRFPDKPVKLVVPYPAGGATDVIARALAERLAATWGQPVLVDNRPGAGTTLAAAQVARAPADGSTLYMTTSAHTISASLYKKLDFDALKDFAALNLAVKVPLVLVVPPSLPARTLAEFTKLAQSRPQGLTYASPGNGTAQHLAGELFKRQTQLTLTHVPYRGDAPAVTDLLAGQVDAMFATLTAVLPHIASGKLVAIALANGKRIERVPTIPTFAEAGLAGFEAGTWFGVLAPAGLAAPLRQRIAEDIARLVAEPEMRRRLVDLGGEVMNSKPPEFEAFLQAESRKWAEVVRLSGATID
ncbi:MAG: tripartite tricarboxylate transporter substrate binding protein [Burkholderiales bacterium]|nr:tripartite tricarboxylate transporter substrate binding protein [Burkholderiales bacterium]